VPLWLKNAYVVKKSCHANKQYKSATPVRKAHPGGQEKLNSYSLPWTKKFFIVLTEQQNPDD